MHCLHYSLFSLLFETQLCLQKHAAKRIMQTMHTLRSTLIWVCNVCSIIAVSIFRVLAIFSFDVERVFWCLFHKLVKLNQSEERLSQMQHLVRQRMSSSRNKKNIGHAVSRKTNTGYWPVDRNVGHVCRVTAEIQGIFKVPLYNGRY